ncbi:DUF6000 family protein [Streptomyces sp. NPDC008141]|uniref:DUF6000 family protein n=1 Tax=Streptomyces sp. NPDC008141 TaxID=3364815 RepID=UPI0036E149FA
MAELLLASAGPCGGAYCITLATFGTSADADVVCRYLDRYLPQPDLIYDRTFALSTLLHHLAAPSTLRHEFGLSTPQTLTTSVADWPPRASGLSAVLLPPVAFLEYRGCLERVDRTEPVTHRPRIGSRPNGTSAVSARAHASTRTAPTVQ